ncbi:MAG: HEAT repeat domain-containing protein, partial [Lentisphaeraceae bacterium]|nr:HEAT repeat domain-containing protein [Lentisphaeraceae bacterium]
AHRHFTSTTRPAEELYDCQNDPQNLHNLLNSATHNDILKAMRQALKQHVIDSKDLGFLPEAMCQQRSQGTTPYEMARQNYPIEKIYDAANKVGMHGEETFLKLLNDKDSALRYWATVGLCSIKKLSKQAIKTLQNSLSDEDISVRIQAADALLHQSTNTVALKTLAKALKSDNLAAVLHAARTIESLGQKAFTLKAAMLECDKRMKSIRPSSQSAVVVQPGKTDMAMFTGFSTNAFLKKLNK